MKITFIGATHEVTGSCYYLEAAGKKFLVDCGMEQGPDYYENQEIPVKGSDLDFVLLTHAHMDHSGNLPAIYAKGFQGPVYATQATCHLCDIMLRDSAHIQMFEAEWRNRKGRRQGKPEFIPAYTMEDALGVLQNFVPCPYEKTITPAEGIRVRFVDAGHLLGSASIEVIINEDGKEKKIVFSGDIGNLNQPLIKVTPGKLAEFQQAQAQVRSALGRLIAVSESYPDLKANQNFLELQAQLEGTENRIAVARKDFNAAAQQYNVSVRRFPANLVARMFGFGQKPYFESAEGAAAAPQVTF